MKKLSTFLIMALIVFLPASARARSSFDGSWNLSFVTQKGACEASYSFTVNINNGVITHPNLVRLTGHVSKYGAVKASVTVQDKFALGSGKLLGAVGYGMWRGHAGQSVCSGQWSAQKE